MLSKTAADLHAENDALFARVMNQFDEVFVILGKITDQMRADGLIRDTDAHTRATDINRLPPLTDEEMQRGHECEVRR